MTVRPGNPQVLLGNTTALGTAAGVNISVNPSSGFAVITAVSIVWTASATVGNRIATLRLVDPAGNVLWSCVFATAVTAGQISRLMAGAGAPATNVANPLQQTFPLPVEFAVPAQSSIQILDAANVDVNDTVRAVVSLAY